MSDLVNLLTKLYGDIKHTSVLRYFFRFSSRNSILIKYPCPPLLLNSKFVEVPFVGQDHLPSIWYFHIEERQSTGLNTMVCPHTQPVDQLPSPVVDKLLIPLSSSLQKRFLFTRGIVRVYESTQRKNLYTKYTV